MNIENSNVLIANNLKSYFVDYFDDKLKRDGNKTIMIRFIRHIMSNSPFTHVEAGNSNYMIDSAKIEELTEELIETIKNMNIPIEEKNQKISGGPEIE